uniref:Uncharacterized protein n=1 Tax=Rhizophora mucronata TaxID=61149 RepID=A0A2P2MWX8_RHIMU
MQADLNLKRKGVPHFSLVALQLLWKSHPPSPLHRP